MMPMIGEKRITENDAKIFSSSMSRLRSDILKTNTWKILEAINMKYPNIRFLPTPKGPAPKTSQPKKVKQ